MKTTIDLPPELLERGKIAAAKGRRSFKSLVVEGLETVLKEEPGDASATKGALARLKRGYRLGNKPLSRDEIHAR